MLWIIDFWGTISKMSTFENVDFGIFGWLGSFLDIPALNVSQTVPPKPVIHTIFNKIFQVHLNI